jgi:multimeric flavodoxin WrbA
MNILILDGNTANPHTGLDVYVKRLIDVLQAHQHTVEHAKLAEKKIKYCTGCWRCWVKNPGQCFVSDDSHDICHRFIHSDFVLFASPVIMGFTSAVLKRLQDKLIPLLHPYIEIVENECHHRKRYDSYPRLGLLLETSRDDDDENVEIIEQIYKRFALNFRSELCFTKLTHQPIEEVVHEINRL